MCAGLVAQAERRAPDEPVVEGAASRAVAIAERALGSLGEAARRDPEIAGYLLVNLAAALRLAAPARDAEVVAHYERAIALDPSRGGWWLGLAVHHKWRLRFAEGLAAALEARARLGDERRVLWNVAICATGAGKGAAAVEALRALGITATLAKGGMPQAAALPRVEVRLRATGSGHGGDVVPDEATSFEVVQVLPFSPCHGVVTSPTLRDAAADVGDVVLWDVAPVAVRAPTREGEAAVPRFPLIAVLQEGDERRFRFLAREQQEGQVAALAPAMPGDAKLFVQHARIDFVCPRCAAGESLVRHTHRPAEEHRVVRGKIVVPAHSELGAFRESLETLVRRHPGVALVVPALHEALGDARAAGKAHTAWAGIERTAVRVGG